MGDWIAPAVLAACVAVMSWASVRLTEALERIGARLRFSEGLLGLVTALGADAPEICSAFAALFAGNHEVGVGLVLGSNIFNLAGLLGLSALVAGRVSIGREGLWFNGGTSLLVSVVVLAVVLEWSPVWAGLAMLAVILVPYVTFTAMHPPRIAALALPAAARHFLAAAVGHAHSVTRKRSAATHTAGRDTAWVALSVTLIVAASVGAVKTAILLGGRLGISDAVTGMLVLAALTSIPNVAAAIRLAREGRGAAVVSESLNSNTLNILAGFCLPALLLGFATSPQIVFCAFWLFGMKLVALISASHRHGLHRAGGALLIVLYFIFALAIVAWN